ncbi:glycerophosphodiester phosphodiesterase family protein [Pannonibacter sp. Pt2-lr]|uniref:Glycerophosphodiester phosphodiesterase family protein n=1 Tax=Pannonibacter anstelovis TaxID=3121537 RepID=A0ABU7ZPT0_9HYPH
MTDHSWIVSRPIAHRGFHTASAGIMENSPTAIAEAMTRNYAIEVDVQETADGRALVFHDDDLDRLAEGTGPVLARTAAELTAIRMQKGTDRLWLLEELLEQVNGKVTLVVEIKSLMKPDAQADFVRHVADRVRGYKGPLVLKSFDPDMLSVLREHAPEIPRGIVADSTPNKGEYRQLTRMQRFIHRHLLHAPRTKPHFISYHYKDLPMMGPSILRKFFGLPIMTWTVRDPADRERALAFADQIIFEGFDTDKV